MMPAASTRQQLSALVAPLRDLDAARRGLPAVVGLPTDALERASLLAPGAPDAFVAALGTPAAALAVARDVLGEVERIGADPNLSPAGKQAAARPVLAAARKKLDRLAPRLDQARAALADLHRARRLDAARDVVGELRRQEIRATLRALTPTERFDVLRGAIADVEAGGAAAPAGRETILAVLDGPGVVLRGFNLAPETLAEIASALDPARTATRDAIAWAIDMGDAAVNTVAAWLASHEQSVGVRTLERLDGSLVDVVRGVLDDARDARLPDREPIA